MNNDKFKVFIKPYVESAIEDLGGLAKVRETHAQMPMTAFVAGWVCGSIMVVEDLERSSLAERWVVEMARRKPS